MICFSFSFKNSANMSRLILDVIIIITNRPYHFFKILNEKLLIKFHWPKWQHMKSWNSYTWEESYRPRPIMLKFCLLYFSALLEKVTHYAK